MSDRRAVEQIAIFLQELSRWFVKRDLNEREQKLVAEYLKAKPFLANGQLRIDRMTTEQYAGLLIKIVGGATAARRALVAAPVDMRKAYTDLDAVLLKADNDA